MKLRKWRGCAHREEEPSAGELALFCAACPQPGINLPDDWEAEADR